MKIENAVLEIQYNKVVVVPCDSRFRTFDYGQMQEHFFSQLDASTRGKEISQFIKEQFPFLSSVIYNAPSESVMIRNLSVPVETAKKSLAVLNYELDSLLPLPLNETVYAYHIYHQSSHMTKAIAYVCKKEILFPLMLLFQKMNITVKGIYVISHALFSLASFVLEQEDSGYLLHLSSTVSYLLKFDENNFVDVRIIPLGSDILTAILAGRWKKSFDESQEILRRLPAFQTAEHDASFYKKHFDINKSQANLIQKTAIEFSANLVDEIKKSKKMDVQQKANTPIFVSSENGSSFFIENLLSAQLGVLLKKFPIEKTPMALFRKSSPVFLSLSMSFSLKRGVNLLSGDLKKIVHIQKSKWVYKLASVIAMAIFFWFASFGYELFLDYQKIRSAEKELTEYFSVQFSQQPVANVPILVQANQILQEEKQRTELMRLFFDRDSFVGYLSVVQEVLSSVPNVEVERIHYDIKSLRVNGTCNNFNDLETIKDRLTEKGVFTAVDSSGRLMPVKNSSVLKFELKLDLTKDEIN